MAQLRGVLALGLWAHATAAAHKLARLIGTIKLHVSQETANCASLQLRLCVVLGVLRRLEAFVNVDGPCRSIGAYGSGRIPRNMEQDKKWDDAEERSISHCIRNNLQGL